MLAKTVLDLAGKNLEIKYEKSCAGDIKYSYADISKAKRLLGYEQKVSLSCGLRTLMKEKGLWILYEFSGSKMTKLLQSGFSHPQKRKFWSNTLYRQSRPDHTQLNS